MISNPSSRISFSSSPSNVILPECLGNTHPFTHQEILDVDLLLYPPNHILEEKLRSLGSTFYEGQLELSEVLDACYDLTGKYSTQSDFLALSEGQVGVEDAWCIDHRGLLTLALTKETYQQLGLVGEKASKKSEIHFVQVDLYDRNSSLFTRAKERIRLWDERRKAQGVPPWKVYVHGNLPNLQSKLQPVKARLQCTTLQDILVPVLNTSKSELFQAKITTADGDRITSKEGERDEDEEDSKERLNELFEWVGMACIGSDRLKANDRVNSFVARYDAPSPNIVGSVTHFRWSGFLGPSTVRNILEVTLDSIKSTRQDDGFVAITANLFRHVPVSYISPKAFAEGAKNEVRLARTNRTIECWSLLVKPCTAEDSDEVEWILATVES